MKKESLRYVLPVLALALMGIGIAMGQHGQVLAKAIRICMECVGIG